VAAGGIGLLGGGAHDAARALLASGQSAGGFLAGSAVYQVVTTTDDLYTLTGAKFAGRVNDRLAAFDTLAEALTSIAASGTERTTQRPLLVATTSTATALSTAVAGDIEAVLLGCSDAATVADIDSTGTITATGTAAAILDEAQSYRLSQDEARALMDRMLAAALAAEPEPELVAVSEIPAQTGHPTAPEPSDPTGPETIDLPLPGLRRHASRPGGHPHHQHPGTAPGEDSRP